MSTFRKVGTFQTLVDRESREVVCKIGGNVAAYVCTPDGRVIHAVPGNVAADVLLRELTWARDVWSLACVVQDDGARRLIVAEAHERLRPTRGCVGNSNSAIIFLGNFEPAGDARLVGSSGSTFTTGVVVLPADVVGLGSIQPLSGVLSIDADVFVSVDDPHALLADRPLPPLEEVFPRIWAGLGEAVSDAPVQVEAVDRSAVITR